MNRILSTCLSVGLALSAVAGRADETIQSATNASADYRSTPTISRAEKAAWFRDAKFGMFIHWGLYAIPAGEWQGKHYPGNGEWIMSRAKIPVARYAELAAQFNPTKFDADAWVLLAKRAGMRYLTKRRKATSTPI